MQPEFIYEEREASEIFDHWLSIIQRLEDSTIGSVGNDSDVATYNSLTMGYTLFPLLDSISFTLFGTNMRRYLCELGHSRADANLITKMFRNGILHNIRARRLKYRNTEISWSLMSTNGSGGFRSFDPGYIDPDDPECSQAPETVLSIFNDGNNNLTALLLLDRLAAQVRHDLLQRKNANNPSTLRLIVGEIVDEVFNIEL